MPRINLRGRLTLIPKNNLVPTIIIVVGLFTAVLWPSPLQSFQQVSASEELMTLSTRGFFNLTTGDITALGQMNSAAVPDLELNPQSCPTNLAIYVHGVWAGEDEAD